MTGMKNVRKTYLFTLRKCRILLFNIRFLLYIDRPAFGLQIHPADVFSDESQYGDDDAAKEQDEADGGRVTWRVLAHDNGFDDLYDEMQGLNWGELYERFHHLPLNHSELSVKVYELMHDDFVTNRRGIFEYVLGGCQDTKLLNVRLFDKPTMRKVYQEQTEKAKAEGLSNCPYCAEGHEANRHRIGKPEEMDADHVTAWSKGGATDISNCQMLCKTHNRAKGNR